MEKSRQPRWTWRVEDHEKWMKLEDSSGFLIIFVHGLIKICGKRINFKYKYHPTFQDAPLLANKIYFVFSHWRRAKIVNHERLHFIPVTHTVVLCASYVLIGLDLSFLMWFISFSLFSFKSITHFFRQLDFCNLSLELLTKFWKTSLKVA